MTTFGPYTSTQTPSCLVLCDVCMHSSTSVSTPLSTVVYSDDEGDEGEEAEDRISQNSTPGISATSCLLANLPYLLFPLLSTLETHSHGYQILMFSTYCPQTLAIHCFGLGPQLALPICKLVLEEVSEVSEKTGFVQCRGGKKSRLTNLFGLFVSLKEMFETR